MGKTRKTLIIVVGCLLIVLLIILLTYPKPQPQNIIKEEIDLNCLRLYAKDFCKNEAISNKRMNVYYIDQDKFNCGIIVNERIGYFETTRHYYFLDKEVNKCKIFSR